MISLEYKVEDAGWAVAIIGNGTEEKTITVSYLNDSLKQLAESAIFINEQKAKRVVFMDEPGEHHLIVKTISDNEVEYELRWYEDWTDWNAMEDEKSTIVLTGKTRKIRFVNEVRNILIGIMENIGTELYEKKWVNHEFPTEEYQKLV